MKNNEKYTKYEELFKEAEKVKTFGNRLKESRIEKQLTQEELAELCDISPKTISNYECGTRTISAKQAKKMSEKLGINPQYLLDFEVTYKNKTEEFFNSVNKKEATELFVSKLGFNFELVTPEVQINEKYNIPTKEWSNLNKDKFDEVLDYYCKLSKKIKESQYYNVKTEKGEIIGRAKPEKVEALFSELIDFTEFKLKKFSSEGLYNG